MTTFEIIKPDDMHLHLRDGEILESTAPLSAAQFARAIVMPNLVPPVTTVAAALAYKLRIETATDHFEPLMVLYLTDNTSAEEITRAAESDFVHAAKLYPAGATTHSDSGVTDIKNLYPALGAMEESGFPLLIHGEVTDDKVDIFAREHAFIESILKQIVADFPRLKVVFEHITTRQAVEFVLGSPANIAATITAHHLLFNRNDLLVGGIRPHYYCLPILKAEEHRQALVRAALSDNPRFFAGTDSAPHLQNTKESDCGCAGCFTASSAIELFAQVFDEEDLGQPETQAKFERFMSKNGAAFYGLPLNTQKLRVARTRSRVMEKVSTAEGDIIPLLAGQELDWSVTPANP